MCLAVLYAGNTLFTCLLPLLLPFLPYPCHLLPSSSSPTAHSLPTFTTDMKISGGTLFSVGNFDEP